MKKYFLPILLALKKRYFEQVLLFDPANTVDLQKVLLSTSVTFTSQKNNKK